MTHSATVLTAAKSIELTRRNLPDDIPTGHVRLKLATASLCGTDLHYYRHFENAGFKMTRPVSLGHEACAYVSDNNDSELANGSLVALNPIINCGECEECNSGRENHCGNKKFPGSATTVPHIDGFFQEEFDFPITCCHPVPVGTKPDHLTFAEPLACAMHSVEMGDVQSNDRVLVTGCGPMGLLAVLAAVSRRAIVDVSDVRQEAVDLALEMGAQTAYIAGKSEIEPNSYACVIEASGSPHAFNQALDATKKRGTVSILSNIQLSETAINLHKIMLKELNIRGSFQFNSEFKEAVRLITSQTFDFEKLIAERFPLDQAQKALEFMLAGKAAGKILLKP